MKVTLTYIKLKSPFKFFPLSIYALNILRQLKATNCLDFKKTGIWTDHYTMTLWEKEQDLKDFARSGAHLTAMKKGKNIAKEIRTLTFEADTFPNWKEAKTLLADKGQTIIY